jgi:UDP-N-acetylmuramate-alanine ligase
MPSYRIEGNQFVVEVEKNEDVKLELFGSHNVLNTEGAKHICCQIGISNSDFYEAIQDFKGAGKRLETIFENDNFIAFRDFAHAPSKVKATIDGMKDQYPNRTLIGCLELHTFSSLNAEFIPQYKNSMQKADYKFVYINQEAVELKRMKLLTKAEVFDAFGDPDLQVFYDREELVNAVQIHPMLDSVLLMMSSGNFGGLNLDKFAKQMVKK